jgi:hypothetical protein
MGTPIGEVIMGYPRTTGYPDILHNKLEMQKFAFLKKSLKVPKCEIFNRSDFHDFYSIKPFWVGDFGAKI